MEPENVTIHTLALKKGSTLMERGGSLPSGAEVAEMLDFSRFFFFKSDRLRQFRCGIASTSLINILF